MGACLAGSGETSATFGSSVPIFFGSHAGTAERLAHVLHDIVRARKVRACVVNLADFADYFMDDNRELRLACNVGIFVVSTYGNGGLTANTKEFADWIRSRPSADMPMKNLRFALYSVGNSEYGDRFCEAGSLIERELLRLGASQIGEGGRGDAKDVLELDNNFKTWFHDTWEQLQVFFPQEACGVEDHAREVPTLVEREHISGLANGHQVTGNVLSQWYFTAQDVDVVSVEQIASKAEKKTVLITLNVPSGSEPEDMFANLCEIRPDNDPDLIKRLAGVFGWRLSNYVAWTSGVSLFPTPCTVETALTRYCDILSLPPRETMQELLEHIPRDDCVKQIVDTNVYDSLLAAHISMVEFAEEFLQEYSLPLELFLIKCPRMQPRTYAVCSTYLEDESCFQIILNEKKIKPQSAPSCMPKLTERQYEGASTWLVQRCPKKVSIMMSESPFLLPPDPSFNILLVATGIAIAPFLGFIRHFMKMALFDRPQSCLLFFGCTHPEDFFFKDELAEAQAEWPGLAIFTAFSREHEQKVYVQQRLLQNQLEVSGSIQDGGYVYVCGGVDVCTDVREAFDEILAVQKINATVDMLVEQGRYMSHPCL